MEDKRNEVIRIGDRPIGADHPTYVIAEIGINHNGDVNLAKELIDAAAEAEVDAVKFQKRHLPSLYREDVLNETHKFEQNFQYMIPLLKQVELEEDDLADLKAYTEEKGMDFICTPFDAPSVELLTRLGIRAFKIASADLNNLELLDLVADQGKPMLVSTGMSQPEEIEKAVALLQGRGVPFALLHCRSVYPVWPREVNLRMINRLSRFGCPVGYSGHELGIVIPLVAASMGASIIEKHITLDKNLPGPDHKISLEPHELKRLVRDIRVADQAMGHEKRFLLRGEILNRELFGKSLMASEDISAGCCVTRERIRVQGPGKGLSPARLDDLVGKTLCRTLKKGDFFLEEDVDGPCSVEGGHVFESRWGLICRFSDIEEMAVLGPKVIEIHLAEKDFDFDVGSQFDAGTSYPQELVVHVPEYMGERLFDLCSGNEKVRRNSVALVHRTMALTRALAPHFSGKPKLVVHPGAMSLNSKLEKSPLRQALMQSIDDIGRDGFEILLENLPPYPWYFGGQWKGNYFMDARQIASFCETAGMHICFDLSHAALYCNAKGKDLAEFVLTVKRFVRHIHFADAYGLDGEGVQIGEGDVDFDAVMPLFSDYQGTWVPEIWRGHLHGGRGFLEALDRLKKRGL